MAVPSAWLRGIVAALVLFLSSDNAARCTGRDYFVDAGWYGV